MQNFACSTEFLHLIGTEKFAFNITRHSATKKNKNGHKFCNISPHCSAVLLEPEPVQKQRVYLLHSYRQAAFKHMHHNQSQVTQKWSDQAKNETQKRKKTIVNGIQHARTNGVKQMA